MLSRNQFKKFGDSLTRDQALINADPESREELDDYNSGDQQYVTDGRNSVLLDHAPSTIQTQATNELFEGLEPATPTEAIKNLIEKLKLQKSSANRPESKVRASTKNMLSEESILNEMSGESH